MLTKTISQLSGGTSLSTTDYIEAEISGASKKITIQTLSNYMTPLGVIVETAYKKTPSETFPAVPLTADIDIDEANYPLLVSELRSDAAEVWLTAGTVVTSVNVNATAGSNLTSVDSAFTIILAALTEEYAIQSAYSIAVTIGGTDYAVASLSSVIGITGTIATGATTMTVYPHRIVGSTTTAKVYKDAGRATMSHDGKLRIAGTRRRHHFQGHKHGQRLTNSGASADLPMGADGGGGPSGSTYYLSTGAGTGTKNQLLTDSPYSDGTNGTPITGPETEPNSMSVWRYIWAQVYNP